MPKLEQTGTGLTPGIAEMMANWDQVLQSLDRVQAYTAARANEKAVRLSETCKAERPALLGESADACQWRLRQKKPSTRNQARGRLALEQQQEAEEEECLTSKAAASDSHSGSTGRASACWSGADRLRLLVDGFDRHLAKEAERLLLEGLLRSWRQVCYQRRREDSHKEGKDWMDRVTTTLQVERETISRLRAQRRERCSVAMRSWQKVQQQLMLSSVFQAWSTTLEVARSASQELASRTRDEELENVKCELKSSQAATERAQALAAEYSASLAAADEAQKSAVAEAQSLRAAAEMAAGDLLAVKSQLSEAEQNLCTAQADLYAAQQDRHMAQEQKAAANRELAQLRATSFRETASESHRLLTDLTIKLAQAEAETAEARTQASQSSVNAQHLQTALSDMRRELEIVYGLLSNSEGTHQDALRNLTGTLRDREIALAHLRHLLEKLREPPAPVQEDEDLKRRLTADTPSASTPGIQSSLSLPSLSSVSSPQSVRTVKSKAATKEVEDRKKRWSANWH